MAIVTDSKDLTENQVVTLLRMFGWDADTINQAINKASISPWEPMPVGMRFTVMCTQYVARMRYRVSVHSTH